LSHAERDGATCSCNFRLPLSLIGVKFRAAWKFCSTGADLIFIGGIANVRAFYMMAFSEIKNVPDLKRKNGRRYAGRLVDGFCPPLSRAEKRHQISAGLSVAKGHAKQIVERSGISRLIMKT
jgi:hypothetical protein